MTPHWGGHQQWSRQGVPRNHLLEQYLDVDQTLDHSVSGPRRQIGRLLRSSALVAVRNPCQWSRDLEHPLSRKDRACLLQNGCTWMKKWLYTHSAFLNDRMEGVLECQIHVHRRR